MSPLHPVSVVDTVVLIDMCIGNYTTAFFRLKRVFVAPDLVAAEVKRVEQAQLCLTELQVHSLDGHQVRQIAQWKARHPRLSVPDVAAFVLAHTLGAELLTGDGNLRDIAQAHGLTVRGSLWTLDECIRAGLLHPQEAARSLQLMLDAGSRLPKAECDHRLHRWQSHVERAS